MIKEPFVICGELVFYDTLEVNGKELAKLVLAHFGTYERVTDDIRYIGKVRITIEKLKEGVL